MISTQFNTNVKTLQSNNGSEFCSLAFQNLLTTHGILHQRSCVYTPQQNGIVDRKHRHLLQIAQALLFQANLRKFFWDHAILMATYLVNRFRSPLLGCKTPYFLLYHQSLDLSSLRCFGCLGFATHMRPH